MADARKSCIVHVRGLWAWIRCLPTVYEKWSEAVIKL